MALHPTLLDRMSPYDLFRLAEDQFAQRDYYGAVGTLERLVADDDAVLSAGHGMTAADELLVRAYFHAALLDKAEAAARRLLESEPDNGYAVLVLARTLQRLNRSDEAEPLLARAEALGQSL